MQISVLLSARKRKENNQNKITCNKPPDVSVIEKFKPKENSQQKEKFQPKELTKKVPRRSPYEKMPSPSIRFDGMNHWINCDGNVRKGVKCKLKDCGKQTSVYCEKCKVHLCFVPSNQASRNCFKTFHILNVNN